MRCVPLLALQGGRWVDTVYDPAQPPPVKVRCKGLLDQGGPRREAASGETGEELAPAQRAHRGKAARIRKRHLGPKLLVNALERFLRDGRLLHPQLAERLEGGVQDVSVLRLDGSRYGQPVDIAVLVLARTVSVGADAAEGERGSGSGLR